MPGTFTFGDNDFLLDGKPFLIRCGEMHYARVPRAYWRHRLQMCRAMGLNAVCAYMYWNISEPQPGEFDFSDNNDVVTFCKMAQEEGLKVILRPGPYSCAEWEFGGFPWWLLKTPDIKVRTRDERYLAACRRYLLEVGRQLAPLQYTRGGPIVMVQVENEYGSYGSDREYIGALRDVLLEAGFTEALLFTCDGPIQLKNDVRDDIFCVVNFGGAPDAGFKALREIRAKGPLMCGEFYPGWFDSWGKKHHVGKPESVVKDIESMLRANASFSIYMVHGGTSFGFSAGANAPPFRPQCTSYDYDAPIAENGDATPKFHMLRELFAKYAPSETFPPVPDLIPVITIPEFVLDECDPMLRSHMPEKVSSTQPLTFEQLDLPHGAVLYRTVLPPGPAGVLRITELHDYARIRIDGEDVATLDRRKNQSSVRLPDRAEEQTLAILVYAFGRVNYGPQIHDRKGITEKVELVVGNQVTLLTGFDHHCYPLSDHRFLSSGFQKFDGPAFYRGKFSLNKVGDTYLDLRQWTFGIVWVNGHNLGRYWNIGPTQTMYCPGCWLKEGENEVIIWELEGTQSATLAGLDRPILDDLKVDETITHRKEGQTIELDGIAPLHTGTFTRGPGWQTIALPKATGRYFCLESLNSWTDDAYATVSEIYLLDEQGNEISREDWKLIYADSEETAADDGNAANVFDLQATTFWHTQWSGNAPGHPHQIVIDLGAERIVTGFKYLPRPQGQNEPPGRIKDYRVWLSATNFPGI